jgi:hypothetical protein
VARLYSLYFRESADGILIRPVVPVIVGAAKTARLIDRSNKVLVIIFIMLAIIA